MKQARTPAEAELLGVTTYFNGRACKHGHVAPRSRDNRECEECRRIRHRKQGAK